MSLGGMKGMDLRMVPYGRDIKPEGDTHDVSATEPLHRTCEPPVEPVVMNPKPTTKTKYRDCMRNHAAAIGGHANDGCGEFMPSTAAADPLMCAACGCHRNFHRKEIRGGGAAHHHRSMLHSPPAMLSYNSGPTKKIGGFPTMGHTSAHRNGGGFFGDVDLRDHHDEVDRRSETPERGEEMVVVGSAGAMSSAAAARNKRFRTRFTQEQKERMLEFAEKLGWRIQKQDDVALNQFCSEIGVKRNVLKVWMHNNKAHRRRESAPSSPPAQPPSPPPAPPQPVGV